MNGERRASEEAPPQRRGCCSLALLSWARPKATKAPTNDPNPTQAGGPPRREFSQGSPIRSEIHLQLQLLLWRQFFLKITTRSLLVAFLFIGCEFYPEPMKGLSLCTWCCEQPTKPLGQTMHLAPGSSCHTRGSAKPSGGSAAIS